MPSKFIRWHGQHTSDERRQSRKNQVRQFIRLLLSLPTSRRGFASARRSCAARAILLTLTASSVSEQANKLSLPGGWWVGRSRKSRLSRRLYQNQALKGVSITTRLYLSASFSALLSSNLSSSLESELVSELYPSSLVSDSSPSLASSPATAFNFVSSLAFNLAFCS